MPVMDEFKESRESIKTASFSKKLAYFKDYYLLKTIAVLVALILAVSFLVNYFSAKETALYVTLVNFTELNETSDGLKTPFAEKYLNPKKQEVIVDHSSFISADENEINFVKYGYEDEQRLFTMVMEGDLDLFISGKDILERYGEATWFDDLSTVLSASELEKYKDSILYQNGIPIAVRIPESSVLNKYYFYSGRETDGIYAGFPAGSKHRETAVNFLLYLLE
jgi:hypothetical protein